MCTVKIFLRSLSAQPPGLYMHLSCYQHLSAGKYVVIRIGTKHCIYLNLCSDVQTYHQWKIQFNNGTRKLNVVALLSLNEFISFHNHHSIRKFSFPLHHRLNQHVEVICCFAHCHPFHY